MPPAAPFQADGLQFAPDAEAPDLAWSLPPRVLPPLPGRVHLWRIDLATISPSLLDAAAATLSEDEQDRAHRFLSPDLTTRFILRRGRLRHILARYLDTAPAALAFEYSPHGKPSLRTPSSLRFNTAHTARLALIAVTQDQEVGVDLESLDRTLDVSALARRYFSSDEQRTLAQAAPAHRLECFAHLWTRKEAILKCRGTGISELTRLAHEPPLDPLPTVRHLPMPFHHIAALALQPLAASP